MTIVSFDDLKKWFHNNQKEDKKSPHWTLYGGGWGEKETRLTANSRINDPEKSLEYLVESIRSMNHPDGTKFRVLLYPENSPHNYTATVYVQVFESSRQPATAAAISGISSGVDVERRISEQVELALLKKEVEELRNDTGGSMWERVMGLINENEHLSAAVGNLITGLVSKVDPMMAGRFIPMNKPVTGHPGNSAADSAPDPNDPQVQFAQNINEATRTLGIDALTLSRSLNQVIQANPDAIRNLIANPELLTQLSNS